MSYLLFQKPADLNTHTPDQIQEGFAEYLERKLQKKLWVCHRLDKATSGAIVMADTLESVKVLSAQFESGLVKKKYFAITLDATKAESEISYSSFIEKLKGQFASHQDQAPNSHTLFKKIKTQRGYTLWECLPQTGKPHQIRLHLKDLGYPILGDVDHEGKPHARMMLHSHQISFSNSDGESILHTSPPPIFFEDLSLLADILLCRYIDSFEFRKMLFYNLPLFTPEQTNAIRMIHSEGLNLCCDQLGDTLWFSWYGEELSPEQMERIKKLSHLMGFDKWYLREMPNRGEDPNSKKVYRESVQASWTAKENSLSFELRSDSGVSHGIFLDQRENRSWVRNHADQKQVLNLFSYTGMFSVMAAKGGAREVTTVDVSKNYLEWSKRNFALNNLPITSHLFYSFDSLDFLQWAHKKKKKYDLIICDPPSFGRSEKRTFKIEKDWEELLNLCLSVLAENGKILFSTNYEKLSQEAWFLRVRNWAHKNKLELMPSPIADYDFERPSQMEPMLKSFILHKV